MSEQQISVANINLSGKYKWPPGTLRVSKVGFGWKNKLGKSVTILSNEIQKSYFIQISKKLYLLSVVSSNGNFRFEGFDEEQVENVSSFAKKVLPVKVEKQERSTKGWNWGGAIVDGSTLFFDVDGKTAFDIPLNDVSQSQVDKNDVTVIFQRDQNQPNEGTQLAEIRFWVPNVNEGEKTTAEELHQKILKNADPDSSSVSGIVTLEQIPLKTPRGRFDIEMFPTSLKLKGTQSSTIPYETIIRIASLPTIDEKDCMIILSLDPPLRRGNTHYNHIIIQFPFNDVLEVDLKLTDEQKEKYKNLLDEKMSGKKSDVVKQLFKVITGLKFTKVGDFRSENDLPAIQCSSKAHEGCLYPMHKCFFFLPTPATFISLNQISHIEFARVASNNQSNRNFDLVIFTKNAVAGSPSSYIFNNIQKEEFSNLKKYLKEKNLVIKGATLEDSEEQTTIKDIPDNESDEEDEDFVEGEGSEEDEDDEDDEFDETNQSIEHIDSQDEVSTEKPAKTNKRKRSNSPSPSKQVRKKQKNDDE